MKLLIASFRPHQGIIEFNWLREFGYMPSYGEIVSVPIRGLLNLTIRSAKQFIGNALKWFPSPSGDY